MRKRRELQELAAEIVRRRHGDELIHLSVPPTASERLQLLAAQLQGTPFVIWPKNWEMLDEWIEYYSKVFPYPNQGSGLVEQSDTAHEARKAIDAEATRPSQAT